MYHTLNFSYTTPLLDTVPPPIIIANYPQICTNTTLLFNAPTRNNDVHLFLINSQRLVSQKLINETQFNSTPMTTKHCFWHHLWFQSSFQSIYNIIYYISLVLFFFTQSTPSSPTQVLFASKPAQSRRCQQKQQQQLLLSHFLISPYIGTHTQITYQFIENYLWKIQKPNQKKFGINCYYYYR